MHEDQTEDDPDNKSDHFLFMTSSILSATKEL